MSARWRVRPALEADVPAWIALRMQLWPDEADVASPDDLRTYLEATTQAVAFVVFDGDEMVGFAEANVRHDYVNGTQTSPVGFLEGLYVKASHRRLGVGRALVAAVAKWTQEHDCTELASDAYLDNAISHAAHRAYGFEETERVVYFRKLVDA